MGQTVILVIALTVVICAGVLMAAYTWRWEIDSVLRQIERY